MRLLRKQIALSEAMSIFLLVAPGSAGLLNIQNTLDALENLVFKLIRMILFVGVDSWPTFSFQRPGVISLGATAAQERPA